jgi:hypothetical protein
LSIISHRACHLVEVDDVILNRMIKELKSYLEEMKVPNSYKVNVYKDHITCCGHMPLGVAVEIEGPKQQPIKDLDEKILGKIKEICGREHVEYHECSPMEILQDIKGVVFDQG